MAWYQLPPTQQHGPSMLSVDDETPDSLDRFGVADAWDAIGRLEGHAVSVAVLDTGYDTDHPDLDGQVIASKDFTNSPHGVEDQQGHGSHVAGIVAAKKDGKGIVGVAPRAKLIIAKVLDDRGYGRGEWVAKGIEWAIEQGASIIVMSLGSPEADAAIADPIRVAPPDVTFFCASGNDGSQVNYPARLQRTIAVGAVGQTDAVTSWSSRGNTVDCAGPGDRILSLAPGGRYVVRSGTSMATPFVAGIAALGQSMKFDKAGVIRQRIRRTARDVGPPGYDIETGAGLIAPVEYVRDVMDGMVGTDPSPRSGGVTVFIPGGKVISPE